jgi:hypothetical protein
MPSNDGSNKIQVPKKIGLPPLHTRAQKAAAEARQSTEDPTMLPNRIGLMLDCSGSMLGEKIQLLQQAYDSFTLGCDMSTTAIAVVSFPCPKDSDVGSSRASGVSDLPLTNDKNILVLHGINFRAGGGTPMAHAMDRMLRNPITRGIIVSDGEADSSSAALDECENYEESETPIDTVHIGESFGGEELLQEIARRTGGIYIKFTDVESFAKSFEFLTPAKRSLLLNGSINALDIGATEIR